MSDVYIDKEWIVISKEYDYEININRIKTKEKLLGWVHHLSEKNWVNTKMIRDFIKCVYEVNGWTRETI